MTIEPVPHVGVHTGDTSVGAVTDEQVASYRRDGFVRVRSVLTRSQAARFADANETDDPRIAHVVIYMDPETRHDGRSHPIADPLGLPVGDAFEHELFPTLPA